MRLIFERANEVKTVVLVVGLTKCHYVDTAFSKQLQGQLKGFNKPRRSICMNLPLFDAPLNQQIMRLS